MVDCKDFYDVEEAEDWEVEVVEEDDWKYNGWMIRWDKTVDEHIFLVNIDLNFWYFVIMCISLF